MQSEITVYKVVANEDGSKYAFAVDEKGDGVYIPAHVCQKEEINTGDTFLAALGKNQKDVNGRCPWYCATILEDEE